MKRRGTVRGVRRVDASIWEMAVRSAVHRQGLRFLTMRSIVYERAWDGRMMRSYRVTPDLYFRGPRLAVFLDGCYWHGCPDHSQGKNADRRQRDQRSTTALTAAGYEVLRIWEHDGAEVASARVAEAVKRHARITRGEGA